MASPYAPPLGRRPTIEWVPVAELDIDPSYQRSIEFAASRRQIVLIANKWNWDLCGTLVVSRRPDDRLFVVDGQHRLAAARMRGDIDSMPCCITRRAGPADEAALFIAANRTRRTVGTLDDFHAAVAAGDPEALAIKALVEAAGLTIARHADAKHYGPNEVGSMAGLRRAVQKHGEGAVGAALRHIGEAFPDEQLVNGATLIGAVIEIHAVPPPGFNPDVLFEVLLERTSGEWSSAAKVGAVKGGRQRTVAMRDAILARFRVRAARAA